MVGQKRPGGTDEMPKLKSHRGAAKRFTTTKSGKIKRSKAYKRHILTKKSTKRLRGLRQTGYIAECEEKKIRKLIPYS
jgi:large subunit ribosomal protein L35